MLRGGITDTGRAYRQQWWRIAILQLLALFGLSAVIAVGALIVQGRVPDLMAYLASDLEQLEGRALGLTSLLIVTITVLTIPFFVASSAATATVTDASLAGGHPRLWRAFGRGFARVAPIFGTVVLAFLLVVASLVATPFISVLGILGLAVTGVIALVRHRKPDAAATWPTWRAWGFAAIPFAWAGRITAAAMLMFPAAVLEPAGPIRAARAAHGVATGRRLTILAVMLPAFAIAIGVPTAATWLGSTLWGDVGASILGLVVQLVALPLPVVAAVALYRRAAGPSGRVHERVTAPAPARVRTSASPAMTRTASAVVATLVLSSALVAGPGALAPAFADPANAGLGVTYTVTSSGDTLDEAELAAQQADCAVGGSNCTVRAALLRAAGDANDGATGATILFSGDMTIDLVSTLDFINGGTGGTLELNGQGASVTLDGGYSFGILHAQSGWNLSITGLNFVNGSTSTSGGGLLAEVPYTSLHNVKFEGNRAQSSGGAVAAQGLGVSSSVFLNNRAAGSTAIGGAIAAAGSTEIINTSFYGSQLGSGEPPILNRGSDVTLTGGSLTVVNSTFVSFLGGSLESAGGGSVRNSIFQGYSAPACISSFSGGPNLHTLGDASCPGTAGVGIADVVTELDYYGYPVAYFPLVGGINPARGAGTACPGYDVLGTERPAEGCDLGAFQTETIATTTSISTIPSSTTVGIVTLRAAVTSTSGAAPEGSVVFTFDGVEYGPVAVASTDGATAVAEYSLIDLLLGATYDYSAVFTGASVFDPSAAGPASYLVEPVPVPVDLGCANPDFPGNPAAAPECQGVWNISETGSIHLYANVVDDGRAGSVVIATDPDGANVVSDLEAVVDGVATFVIPASAFGLGSFPTLHAIYLSDDGQHAGVSPIARPLVVLRTPTVTISDLPAAGTYGDTATGTVTVTVSGAGDTPTGTVTVFGFQGTLDANGTAEIDISGLGVQGGDYDIVAQYLGDTVYGRGTSNTLPFHTTRAGSSTEITGIAPAAPQFGESIAVTVTVTTLSPSSAPPEGSVTITVDGTETFGPVSFIDSVQDGDGETDFVVIIPAAALGAGDHVVLAEFAGSGNFDDSESDANDELPVAKAATSTTLIAAPTSAVPGDQVTLTATVDATGTASLPTGTVAFSAGASGPNGTVLGTASLSPCDPQTADACAVASLTVSASLIGIGTSTLTATYQGTADFAGSVGTSAGYVVGKATPTVTVSGAGSVVYGDASTYTVTVGTATAKPADGTTVVITAVPITGSPIPLGTVSLLDGSGTFPVATVGGLAPGSYTLTASFAENTQFLAATGSTTITVTDAATNLDRDSTAQTSVTYGETNDVVLTIRNTSTSAFPEGQVVVTWAGWEVGRVTLSAAHDTSTPGVRTVTVPAVWGVEIPMQSAFWLTARYEPASGFGASQLSTGSPTDERIMVALTPLTSTTSVTADFVFGLPVAATATVDIAGDFGIVPEGIVFFTLTGSGHGFIDVGSTPLVNGQATLDAALGANPDIIVDLAGTWKVTARFVPGPDGRYTAEIPDNIASYQADVQPGGALVTATAPSAIGFGEPLVVHVKVIGAVQATGKVRIQSVGVGNVVVSDEVQLVDGEADVTVDPAWLTIGSKDFFAQFVLDPTLNNASSQPFTVVVGPTSTTTTVTTTSQVVTLYPGMLGGQVQYTAHVTAAVGTPAGIVTFYRDSTAFGQAVVTNAGNATVNSLVDTVWSGTIRATFEPYSGTVGQSTGTLAHSWIRPPVAVSLIGPASGAIGVAAGYTAQVRFDFTDYQYLGPDQLPPSAPSGSVTVSDGAGTSCTAILSQLNSASAQGDCSIQFLSVGTVGLRASYGGDTSAWAPGASAMLDVAVGRGTPTVNLYTPNGNNWLGLTTMPVSWQVQGPAEGTITIKRGAEIVCTSTSMSGTCTIAIPAWDRTANANVLTLEYGGSTLWKSGTTTRTGTLVACVPFQASTANPAGSATVFIQPSPTCGAGTGYYTTDTVIVSAQPTDGYTVSGFSGGLPAGGTRFPYPAEDVTLSPNGGAQMTVHPSLGFSGSNVIPFGIQANTASQCVSVRFTTTGIANPTIVNSMILWDLPFNDCAPAVVTSGNSYTASIPTGTQLQVSVNTGLIPESIKFYGWKNLESGDPYATTATYTVDPAHREITAAFGQVCFSNAPTLVQPADGTITLNLPVPNCNDPSTGTSGWVKGTPGSATLVDAVVATVQDVENSFVNINGKPDTITTSAYVPSKPVYFDGWRGDTGSFTVGPTTQNIDAAGARRESHQVSFVLSDRPFTIAAAYGGCAVLTTAVIGDSTDGVPGTVTMNTPGNCPISAGAGRERWYKTGTTVSVTEKDTSDTLKFLGWSGLGLTGARIYDETASFTITSTVTATASYGANGNCRPIAITAVPSAVLSLATTYQLGANACEAAYGPKFYDQGLTGNSVDIEAIQTGAAVGSQTVFQWATNPPGSPSGSNNGISSIWERTGGLQQEIYGDTTILAYACEFVQVGAAVWDPEGNPVDGTLPGSGASNTDPATHHLLEDFLITQPADCAVGADPKSQYGGYAWLVGTQLKPIQVADPVAYRFTGWSGDVTGTGNSPDAALTLQGAGHAAEGDTYNFHVTANYEAICYELTTPPMLSVLEVLTAPNCPYTEEGKNLYLGGTAVIVHAADISGWVYVGWTAGVDAIDSDPHWASLIMTADTFVDAKWRETTVIEDITKVATKVGDSLAIASKKMIGVASATMAAYAKEVLSKATLVADGLGYFADGLEYIGVQGSVTDGMQNMSKMMNSVIGILWAPMDCITAWSAGGEDNMFFAAQNAIGTGIVTYMSLNAQKLEEQVVSPVSEWDKLVAAATELAEKAAKKAEPAVTAATALAQAKKVYDSSSSGLDGWESSAYEAWGSQASLEVYTTCMAGRVDTMADNVSNVAP